MTEPRPPLRTILRDPADPERVDAMWSQIAARRAHASRKPIAAHVLTHRGLRAAALGLSCAAALAAVVWLRGLDRPETQLHQAASRTLAPADTAPPDALALGLSDGSPLVAVETGADAPRLLQLSDGTRIELAAGSRLVPRISIAAQLEVALEQGRARFEVRPQGARRFAVIAGELVVEVVGTAFTVERAGEEVSVAVEHGRVRVRHAALPNGMALLEAGQSLRWPPTEPDLPSSRAPDTSAGKRMQRWQIAAEHGDYERAYALLGSGEYARAVQRARDAGELLALADMARSAGKPAQAVLALGSLVQRHARDPRAALAAVTLGKLQLDALGQAPSACPTFQRAIDLGLPSALQEDTWAHLVEACARAGDRLAARRGAEQYRQRFPDGRWRARVQAWAERP